MNSRPLLLVFLRAPVLGKVKTRLAATLGKERALVIYKRLLQHTIEEGAKLGVDRQAWYSDDIPPNEPCAVLGYSVHQQIGADLGERMQRAFDNGFVNGHGPIIIIGTDLPQLSEALLREALKALGTHDAVIGPANDGGYYLLGLRKPCAELFQGKTWSTDTVFKRTTEDLERLGRTWEALPELIDIDTEADLEATGLP
ncbi:MAG TPA: TIGR04282 family arsenosugar biosynthesis glycosyltransferase [Flavobacteriales bacterium]|jgi:rSAM/selenodomain-associated transferase 1|nr:TIGR04282 family arsenosugar biosynthesis glycosyltransferase [Flavobacteriales bacterium]HQW33744.1 TIGR04282 family arsenosugar biosynthesis glycosyltransferase [Flavobacteriales bacterium]HQY04334.1 TIGR04282 family arsenosugar biosynthesis glycosyltransferase [Flavobacteriales bacterium]HQY81105.1 TIGR04282 family arsenosugar biosynthesis glycosyltransferase [Flavobacteriales bacterium]HRA16206.1 TIGR04282 family arsenosugar biosynthesis glycosyltransferase [Flavobacteriales bacterium]